MEVATSRNSCHPYGWCGRAHEDQGRKEISKTQKLRGEDLGAGAQTSEEDPLAKRCWGF